MLLGLAPAGVIGFLVAGNAIDFASFVIVTLAALVPLLLWIRIGTPGMPLLPAISGMYVLYFAVPALRGAAEAAGHEPRHVLDAAITVGGFLLASALAWVAVANPPRRRADWSTSELPPSSLVYFVFFGLALGSAYYLALYLGLLGWIGGLGGVLRAVALTSGSLACYLLGYARAHGRLRGAAGVIAAVLMAAMVAFALSTLFLVGAAIFCIAAAFGYFVTTKKIPWKFIAVVVLVFSVLQAGKADMRRTHWVSNSNYTSDVSIFEAPQLVWVWARIGVTNLVQGEDNATIIDRTSLLNQLIRVQRLTPQSIPYYGGESYSKMPAMLVPRFLDSDKASSQVVMDDLNVRYGFLTREGTRTTAAGWNLISEAYANFGQIGVLTVGIIFGLLTGLFTRISVGASAISYPMLLAISAFVTMLNLEADLSSMAVSLFQSSVAVTIFFLLLNLLVSNPKRAGSAAELAQLSRRR